MKTPLTAKQAHKAKMGKLRASLKSVSFAKYSQIRDDNHTLVSFLAPYVDMPVSVRIWRKLFDMGRTPARLERKYN